MSIKRVYRLNVITIFWISSRDRWSQIIELLEMALRHICREGWTQIIASVCIHTAFIYTKTFKCIFLISPKHWGGALLERGRGNPEQRLCLEIRYELTLSVISRILKGCMDGFVEIT